MSVTVFMKSGDPINIRHAAQWNFTRGTLELGDVNGDSVGSFLAEDVSGCVLNDPPQQASTTGSHRDKTGEPFGFAPPEDEEDE
jgi:hypothetical protein